MNNAYNDEVQRIKAAYAKRDKYIYGEKYSVFNRANLFIKQRIAVHLLETLKRAGINSLSNLKILDVGCGYGENLLNFVTYGANPNNLYGIDILKDRIEKAKEASSAIKFSVADIAEIHEQSNYFDIVTQFTVFTSVTNYEYKKNMANEMIRVTSKNGIILWYDFCFDNPNNPDVRGVKKREIYDLFSGYEIRLKKVIPAPPLTSLIAPYSWISCLFLEKLVFLNTHYIGYIRKI